MNEKIFFVEFWKLYLQPYFFILTNHPKIDFKIETFIFCPFSPFLTPDFEG